MKIEIVPSIWLVREGHRLDCQPFTSGGIAARMAVEKLSCKKNLLKDLTQNGLNGIYHVGQEKIRWVESEKYGVPFLRSSDILKANIENLTLISKEQVSKNPLFTFPEGTILITRSGTIGRTVFAREEMLGMAASQDVLKVVPDSDKIPPGYLFAYLSSRYGLPQIVSGTFGSIIVHIEAENIADLPVPRLGKDIEEKAHYLVLEAARIRTDASYSLDLAIRKLENNFNLPYLPRSFEQKEPDISIASSKLLNSRLDALFHSNYHKSTLEPLLNLPESERTTVGMMADQIFEPNRLKRVPLDNSDYGIPFFGTTALMWIEPLPSYYVPNKTSFIKQYIVDSKTVLIPRSGQLGGIIGHAVLPYGQIIEGTVSEHAIRVIAESPIIAGYLYIALISEYGRRQLKSRAFGSSIPTLDVNMIKQVIIPKPKDKVIEEIGTIALTVSQARSEAIDKEQQARKLVEEFIELEGGA